MKTGIIFFVGGVVVGITATFLFMNKRCEDRIAEEVAEVKKVYSEKPKVKIDVISNRTRQMTQKELAELNVKRKQEIIATNDIIQKHNYNIFSNPIDEKDIPNDEFVEDYEEVVDTTPPKEGYAEKPFIITDMQFVNEEPYFDKISLDLYNDGTLVNALSDEIITDVDATVGQESLTKFKGIADEVIYIRNEAISTDYEVIFNDRPFIQFPEGYD